MTETDSKKTTKNESKKTGFKLESDEYRKKLNILKCL